MIVAWSRMVVVQTEQMDQKSIYKVKVKKLIDFMVERQGWLSTGIMENKESRMMYQG